MIAHMSSRSTLAQQCGVVDRGDISVLLNAASMAADSVFSQASSSKANLASWSAGTISAPRVQAALLHRSGFFGLAPPAQQKRQDAAAVQRRRLRAGARHTCATSAFEVCYGKLSHHKACI